MKPPLTVMEWLGAQWVGPLPFGSYGGPAPGRLPDQPTRLQVLAALVYMNAGTTVRGWGVTTGDGIYGNMGLDQEGAWALLEAWAFVSGMLAATGEAEIEALTTALKEEHARVAAIHAAVTGPVLTDGASGVDFMAKHP
jgi:hypothetical protein